jgi:hypothetical protein
MLSSNTGWWFKMSAAVKARVASGILLALLALAWFTLDPGKVRLVTLLILGLFLFRIVIHAARSRYDEGTREEDEEA